MKYTNDALNKAINLLLPKIAKAKENGVSFNTPSLLTMVAEQYFVNNYMDNLDLAYDERVAYYICHEALEDLKVLGYMDFGTKGFGF